MIRIIAIAMLAMLTSAACKSKQNTAAQNGDSVSESTKTTMADTIPSIQVDPEFTPPRENDLFTINKVWMEGDQLVINVSYSGGCEDHDFSLHSNGMYMKSMPPKLNILLVHNANGDACRSLLERTYRFDMAAAKYPNDQYGKLMLRLDGWKEEIVYEY